jgi:hypothetical protein
MSYTTDKKVIRDSIVDTLYLIKELLAKGFL